MYRATEISESALMSTVIFTQRQVVPSCGDTLSTGIAVREGVKELSASS
jgi:hypothetical protein